MMTDDYLRQICLPIDKHMKTIKLTFKKSTILLFKILKIIY